MGDLPDYSDKRFLVVDDEEFMRNVIVQILRQLSVVDVSQAFDGSTAVGRAKADGKPYDCIICDFNMKPINGLMFLKAIRTGKLPIIPRKQTFIMLTGHGETEIVKIASKLDVSGYLVKPVPTDKLVVTLKRAFETEIAPKNTDAYNQVSLGPAEEELKSGDAGAWHR